MKWSKLKSEIEGRVCDSMRNRFAINSTTYGNCSCGHAWLTIDKEVVANFCTRAFWNTKPVFDKEQKRFVHGNPTLEQQRKYEKQFVDYGEMSRQDVYEACFEYFHDLSIEESLLSDDPLIQTLAVIDKRVGKNRVAKINKDRLHPLAKKLLEERIATEIVKHS